MFRAGAPTVHFRTVNVWRIGGRWFRKAKPNVQLRLHNHSGGSELESTTEWRLSGTRIAGTPPKISKARTFAAHQWVSSWDGMASA